MCGYEKWQRKWTELFPLDISANHNSAEVLTFDLFNYIKEA